MANPDAGDAASHENWLRDKEKDGWTFGPVKDAEKKEHPCFVPFDHDHGRQTTRTNARWRRVAVE